MSVARDEILRRRERLLSRSEMLRQDWSQQAQAVRSPLRLADRVRDGTQWLLHHPEWPIGVALLLVVLKPGRALRWSTLAWQGYLIYRRVHRLMARPGPALR